MKKRILLVPLAIGAIGGANAAENNATKSQDLGQIVVQATVSAVDNLKYAGSAGILTPKDMKAKTNVIDSIMQIPGVDGSMDMGRQIGRQFQIRGFGYQSDERVIIKQDGVRRSAGMYSNMISSFRTDSDILKRVEVIKGASSVLHGSGAIGGIVNMQTKSASDYLSEGKSVGLMLGQRLESNNMHSTRGAVYGKGEEIPIDVLLYGKRASYGNIKFADGGTHYARGYDKSFNNEHIDTGFFKIGASLDDHRISFSAFDYDENLHTMWQTLWQNDADLFVSGNLSQRDYVFDWSFTPQSPLVDMSFKAYKSRAEYKRSYIDGADTGSYTNKDDRKGLEIKNISEFDTDFLNHSFAFGGDYENRQEDAIFIRNGVLSDFASFPNEYNSYGLFAQDLIRLHDDLELTLGGRYDRFDRDIKGKPAKFKDSRFSPRAAIAYTLFDKFTLLAGYSESFRAPTPHETSQSGPINRMYYYIPNPDLKPETVKEYEVGFSFKQDEIFTDDHFNMKFIYFNGNIKDMIDIKPLPHLGVPPGGFSQQYGQYQNIDQAKRHGFELSSNYQTQDFDFGASFERLRIYNKKTHENINNHAKKLSAHAFYSPLHDLNLGFEVSHYFKPHSKPASYFARRTEYFYVDKAFTIANFRGSYKIKNGIIPALDGADVSFGVNNIFDKHYINANRTRETVAVGAGRNFYVDLEVRF